MTKPVCRARSEHTGICAMKATCLILIQGAEVPHCGNHAKRYLPHQRLPLPKTTTVRPRLIRDSWRKPRPQTSPLVEASLRKVMFEEDCSPPTSTEKQ